MPDDDPYPVKHARQVGIDDGLAVHAYACGNSFCSTDKVFTSRLVAVAAGGTPLYAAASEGCEYPGEFTPEFVLRDEWPPYGISRHVLARVTDVLRCPGLHCSEAVGEYQEDLGSGGGSGGGAGWVFQIGPVRLTMTVTGAGAVSFSLAGSSCSVNFASQPQVLCDWPLHAKVILTPRSSDCCGCCPDTTSQAVVEVFGYCDRVKLARQVSIAPDGLPVYAFAECPPGVACQELTCCGDYFCRLRACFTGVSGGCGCLDGQCVDLEPVAEPGVDQTWQNNLFGSCSRQWDARLDCLGAGSGAGSGGGATSRFRWQMSCNPNCTADEEVEVFHECGQDFDVEFEFTLNCPVCDPSPPAPVGPCCDCGDYTYMVRITRAPC